ncbi:MAG: type II toxin-antitoxin system RelE/ParE family toxin [Anaerolineae bacterium]|nr:type II toxin-antitoxin system RelE/ParE family toxin [Phycisphaerae bacterium]
MSYTVRFSDRAERELTDLPRHIQRRVARWIELLASNPYRSPSRKLDGFPELRRVHASKDYVIVYSVFDAELVVLVVRIAHRREVYRRL